MVLIASVLFSSPCLVNSSSTVARCGEPLNGHKGLTRVLRMKLPVAS